MARQGLKGVSAGLGTERRWWRDWGGQDGEKVLGPRGVGGEAPEQIRPFGPL